MVTWLRGQVQWSDLTNKIIELLCGESADDFAVTAATEDRWQREVAAQNNIMNHNSANRNLGNMSNRAGYFALIGSAVSGGDDWHVALSTVCRCTNVFTSAPGGATNWFVSVAVTVANSVPGNYSTATVEVIYWNADTGVSISSATGSPNAAGVISAANGMQITLSDPSGTLSTKAKFVRQYSTTYVGGIDWFGPAYWMKGSGAVTFSTAPSGTQTTDWDLVDITTALTQSSISMAGTPDPPRPRGGFGHGVGIKTNTGLSGNLYTYTYASALIKIRLTQLTGGSAGQIEAFYFAKLGFDGVSSYNLGGGWPPSGGLWLRPFQTPGSVLSSSLVQYWIAVGPDHFSIALSGDPGVSGKTCFNAVGTHDPIMTDWDVFPSWIGASLADYTAAINTDSSEVFQRMHLWDQKKFQDLSENRDWQTRWSRCDFMNGESAKPDGGGSAQVVNQLSSLNLTDIPTLFLLGPTNDSNGFQLLLSASMLKPSPFDDKWWIMALVGQDHDTVTSNQTEMQDSLRAIRGELKHLYFVPSGGWANGDELIDLDVGETFYLWTPDYLGVYNRLQVSSNNFRGGLAISETH